MDILYIRISIDILYMYDIGYITDELVTNTLYIILPKIIDMLIEERWLIVNKKYY